MSVLIVSEPGMDGVFRFVEALVHFLVGQGVQVHLAYSDRRSCDRLVHLVDFVRDSGGATLNLGTSNRPGWSDLPALHGLRRLARQVRPEVIHSHSSKAGALARVLPWLGVRAVQVYHPHAYSGMRPQPALSRVFYESIERLLGYSGTTINCSDEELIYAHRRLQLPPARTVLIHNGVDTAVFRPPAPREKRELRREFGLPEDGLVLGTLGRASQQKDPLTLYRAFALARDRRPDLTLFHLGKGELDPDIEQFAREKQLHSHIRRLPYLGTPADFYRAIDGFILTSLYEGMSIAALEALSCNLPLILSEAPGNYSLIRLPLSHLWSAPIGDVARFTQSILDWAAACNDTVVAQSSNHRATALAHFDCRKNLPRLLAFYRQLTAARARPRTEEAETLPRAV